MNGRFLEGFTAGNLNSFLNNKRFLNESGNKNIKNITAKNLATLLHLIMLRNIEFHHIPLATNDSLETLWPWYLWFIKMEYTGGCCER